MSYGLIFWTFAILQLLNFEFGNCSFLITILDAMLQFSLAAVLLVAEFSNVQQVVEGVQEFKRCYNTSEEETHCFDVQYDASTNQPLLTSFQNAQRRCMDVNSTLVIIKNEEIDNLLQVFMRDSNPIGNQYFWLNAYQVSYYNNSYRWHWLNSTLPNLPESAVSFIYDSGWNTAVLESDRGGLLFRLMGQQPKFACYYVCEYSVSNCSSFNSSNYARLMNGRCYRAVQVTVSWYEARNRCLKDGGDLASFANVTSINFDPWLGPVSPYSAYWIGLRFTWYTWGDAGQELKFTNLDTMNDPRKPCLIFCFNCDPPFAWSSRDCNTDPMYVVCHTITSLAATTTPAVKTSTFAGIATSVTTILTTNIQQVMPSSSRAADGICSSQGSLGVGLGVGLGLPLAIFIILTVFFAVKSKRLETLLEEKSRNDRTELGAVQTQSVGQVNESPNDQYQQLNRNLDISSGTMMYDKLRVTPETQYEEFPPS